MIVLTGLYSLEINSIEIYENTMLTVTVERSQGTFGESGVEVMVNSTDHLNFASMGATAPLALAHPAAFNTHSFNVTFDAGDAMPKILHLFVTDDGIPEPNHSVHIAITEAFGGAAYCVAEYAINVIDDDDPNVSI